MKLILKFFYSFFAGFEWVGWSNDSVGSAGRPIELTFQFDTVRNFSAMILHTNNMFSKSIQVSDFGGFYFLEIFRDYSKRKLKGYFKNSMKNFKFIQLALESVKVEKTN